MILIVESGSTKADFVLINQNGQLLLSFQTMGLNPLFLSTEQIQNQLKSQVDLMRFSEKIEQVYFFGAGCRAEKLNLVVQKAFEDSLQNAHCQVDSDLMAACLSVSFQRKSLVGILGTGSNACYFDSEKV